MKPKAQTNILRVPVRRDLTFGSRATQDSLDTETIKVHHTRQNMVCLPSVENLDRRGPGQSEVEKLVKELNASRNLSICSPTGTTHLIGGEDESTTNYQIQDTALGHGAVITAVEMPPVQY